MDRADFLRAESFLTLGIDIPYPRFSWTLESAQDTVRGQVQQLAYQLVVTSEFSSISGKSLRYLKNVF